ncbi:MAG TPA: polysaccharide deacetylase family protein [Bacteroidales bacterium]|nr:polysaccharide deacetylase family protein [Bacteroidales bacterium]
MEPRPVMIYAAEDSPRLRYVAGIIIGDILGLKWDLITDKRKLGKHDVINYSDENIKDSFRISPSSILFEKGIKEKEIIIEKWRDLPVFFQTSYGSDLPFDIFAASFYLISRYEEYLEFEPDEYGRFRAFLSLSFRNGFLGIPVVDLWAREFARGLLKKFHTLAFKRNEFKSVITFDADEPFEYLGKGIIRSLGGLIRDLTVNEGNAGERYKTVTGGKPDPFEVFDYITECIDRNNSDAIFFFPVGDRSKYDHNPSWKNVDYRSLILRLAGKYKHGIHPSFNASESFPVMEKEVKRYSSIIVSEGKLSRFHYLRLKLPNSYRILLQAGIEEDYSMGYHDEPGFRAGIARPFYFYDIENEITTKLRVFPFQMMDVTMFKYKKVDSNASLEIILKLIGETRKAGGLFVTIWHNTSLLDNPDSRPWRFVFESMLNAQK